MKVMFVITFLLFLSEGIHAQQVITGEVSDSGGPLIGASITVKDAKKAIGTVTDINGRYTITVPSSKSVLVYSYVGYIDRMEIAGKRKVINMVLKEDEKLLDDVVVIGYGTQKKSHLTGSISKIESENISKMHVSDVATALQGQMTGLTVSNETSEVGVTPSIRVRGTGSISADSEPLVVVDGFPVPGGLSSVNAQDIKSIEILKDAASAAIYGSRAANGVIMVTTKSGSPDKPKYSFSFYEGIKYAYQLHDLMNSQEYLDMLMRDEAAGGPSVGAAARSAAYIEQNIGATDWQKEGLRDNTSIMNAQFSIQGGKNEVRYFISTSYTKDQGVMKANEVDKLTFRSKIDTKLSKIVSLGTNFAGTYIKGTRPKNNFIDYYRTPSFLPVMHNDFTTELTGYKGFTRGSHFNNIVTPTMENGVDENGNPIYENETSSPFTSSNNNPACVLANTTRWNESFQGVGNLYLTVDICKGLQFKTSNGVNVKFQPQYYYGNANATKDGELSNASYYSTLYIDLLTENTLNYTKHFGANSEHSIEALIGYTAEKTRLQYTALTGSGFATDDIQTLNAATVYELASTNNGKTDGTGTFRNPDVMLESYLGRINYSYMDKYLLSTSLRLDRSSLFSKNKRNAWFPSVSLGWRVSEEKFLKDNPTFSNLKLRASYGVTGNNNIPYNASLETLNSMNYVLGTGNGKLVNGSANTSNTLANPNITWEQTDEFNYGFDLGLIRNKINLSVDAYYSVTRSLLFAQPSQSFTGFTYFWNNIGKVRNSGLEIELTTHNVATKKMKWDTNINFSMTRNKLLELGGEKQLINKGERQEGYLARVGDPLIQFYGYKTDGVWKTQSDIDANPHFSSDVPGGLRVVDTDHNGVLNDNDRVALANPYPDFTWGMTNTLTYKNWDFSFLIQGVQGITVFNGDAYYNETWKWNKAYTENRWVSESAVGDGKTPYNRSYGIDLDLTDYPLQDASYACLRNVSLGYTFSKGFTKKLGIKSFRFYATGTNLLYVWTSEYKGINPESRYTSGQYTSSMISGYQRGGFPLTSSITVGFDINF